MFWCFLTVCCCLNCSFLCFCNVLTSVTFPLLIYIADSCTYTWSYNDWFICATVVGGPYQTQFINERIRSSPAAMPTLHTRALERRPFVMEGSTTPHFGPFCSFRLQYCRTVPCSEMYDAALNLLCCRQRRTKYFFAPGSDQAQEESVFGVPAANRRRRIQPRTGEHQLFYNQLRTHKRQIHNPEDGSDSRCHQWQPSGSSRCDRDLGLRELIWCAQERCGPCWLFHRACSSEHHTTHQGKTARGRGRSHPPRGYFRVRVIPTPSTRTFEILLVKVINCTIGLTIAVIYRPPSTKVTDFVTELSDLIDSGSLGPRYIICGDLNCPGPSGTKGSSRKGTLGSNWRV